MPRYITTAVLRQPERIEQPGLLVGWSLEAEAKKAPIGFNYGNPLRTPDAGYLDPVLLHGEGHLMTIAPTGAGKGTGCIVPALLRFPGPVIVVDPKGENAAITARRRREMGHRVVVVDPFGVTDLPCDNINPLDAIDITQASAVDEVAALAHMMGASAGDNKKDRFWTQRSVHLLTGVILEVLQKAHEAREMGLPTHGNLMAVRDLVNEAAGTPAKISSLLGGSRHPEVRRIASMLNIAAPETLGGIISFAQDAVDFLRGDRLQAHLTETTFDLADVTAGAPLSIYLVLPPHMLESHGRLLRLWLNMLLTCITRRRARPAINTLLLLDEAAQLGELSQLRQAVTLLRGYGIQTWSFWQDVSQLQTLYPSDWKTMVNNCHVLQCFGALNQVASEDMARLTGFRDGGSVLSLEHNEMILQLAGDQAVIAQVPNYRTDPAFEGMFDPNPYHDRGRDVMPRRSAPQRLYERARHQVDLRPSQRLAARKKVLPHAVMPLADPLLNKLLSKWPADGQKK